jgi:hypothetical protein
MRGLKILLVACMTALLSSCEIDRLDAEVKRLCAIDGGIKIYETVMLPPEKFNAKGLPELPFNKDNAGFGYFYKQLPNEYLAPRRSDYEGPNMWKEVTHVVRSSDQKVLAVVTRYVRAGGEFLQGPIHYSANSCPGLSIFDELLKKTFIKGEKK